MCGGSGDFSFMGPKAPSDTTYTAPDMRDAYKRFKETGTVPYSYYGQGAPKNADELALVRASYPGAFSAPTPAPASGHGPGHDLSSMSSGWLGKLIAAMRAGGSGWQ